MSGKVFNKPKLFNVSELNPLSLKCINMSSQHTELPRIAVQWFFSARCCSHCTDLKSLWKRVIQWVLLLKHWEWESIKRSLKDYPSLLSKDHCSGFCWLPTSFHPNLINEPQSEESKGQLDAPLTAYPWYLLCSFGILGDYNLQPIITHYI